MYLHLVTDCTCFIVNINYLVCTLVLEGVSTFLCPIQEQCGPLNMCTSEFHYSQTCSMWLYCCDL